MKQADNNVSIESATPRIPRHKELSLQVAEFASYFEGSEKGYGLHEYNFNTEGKESGKNYTITDKLVTANLYQDHINGKKGLGIIPIRHDGTCKFTVMDVDIYDTALNKFLTAIDKHNLPLVPFRSKSGGLHIYTFFREYVDAKQAVDFTKRMAKLLSLDTFVKHQRNVMLEIFPKQTSVQKGKFGNWINLPYYNSTETNQPALYRGEELVLDDAIMLIKERATTIEEALNLLEHIPYNDAPPCLQTIYLLDAVGENEGRNNYLFSFGAYLQRKDETLYEAELMEVNSEMSFPLPVEEIESTIISSLNKRAYNYKCTQAPCSLYCNKAECRTREYGVGKDKGYFSNIDYGKLRQFKQEQPYYEWEVRLQGEDEYRSLRFRNESEIIKQDVFQQLCFRELHVLPPKLRESVWAKIVTQSLAEIEVVDIEESDATGAISIFKMYFHEFIKHSPAKTKYQIEDRRPYHDDYERCFYFRAVDLVDFLFVKKNFRDYRVGDIHAKLRDLECFPERLRTERGKQIRVYRMSYGIYNTRILDPIGLSNEQYERMETEEGTEGEENVEEVSVEDLIPDMTDESIRY